MHLSVSLYKIFRKNLHTTAIITQNSKTVNFPKYIRRIDYQFFLKLLNINYIFYSLTYNTYTHNYINRIRQIKNNLPFILHCAIIILHVSPCMGKVRVKTRLVRRQICAELNQPVELSSCTNPLQAFSHSPLEWGPSVPALL